MHSSRMRTGRSLTVCRGLVWRGVCSWGGVPEEWCVPEGGVPEGVPEGGVPERGVPEVGGGCQREGEGVWSRRGIPACTEADFPPLWTEW